MMRFRPLTQHFLKKKDASKQFWPSKRLFWKRTPPSVFKGHKYPELNRNDYECINYLSFFSANLCHFPSYFIIIYNTLYTLLYYINKYYYTRNDIIILPTFMSFFNKLVSFCCISLSFYNSLYILSLLHKFMSFIREMLSLLLTFMLCFSKLVSLLFYILLLIWFNSFDSLSLLHKLILSLFLHLSHFKSWYYSCLERIFSNIHNL